MITLDNLKTKSKKAKKKTTVKKPAEFRDRPPLDPQKFYDRKEGAQVLALSPNTLIRAYESGNLLGFRAGIAVRHTGQQLLDWLASGGRTTPNRKRGKTL